MYIVVIESSRQWYPTRTYCYCYYYHYYNDDMSTSRISQHTVYYRLCVYNMNFE